jgi:hypothetical protein
MHQAVLVNGTRVSALTLRMIVLPVPPPGP